MVSSVMYDLIVVGSGSVGSAAGYYAAKSGLKVLMVDSHSPPHTNASHHGATRIIRQAYGEGEKYLPMILRARQLWDELTDITTKDILTPCGVINIGPKDSDFIKNCYDSASKYKLNTENLTAKEISDRWPGIKVPIDYAGIFEIDTGYLRPELAIENFVRLSKDLGAEQVFQCEVTAIKEKDGTVEVVANNDVYKGLKVAVTIGTWVKTLVPNVPITPLRKVFAWHDADERYGGNFPCFIIELAGDSYYGFPKDTVGVKIGKHDNGQVIQKQDEVTPFGNYNEDDEERNEMIKLFFPGIGKVVKGESCSYDMSPDDDFIIDKVPNANNILVITGLSGHGYKFATVLGEIVALFAKDETPDYDITPFSLKRFPNFV